MKVVATIEARMGSSRLPGKVMKPILGKAVLELLIERLKRATTIDEIVVATTVKLGDNAINDLCQKLGVRCFRGSEEDVLKRVLDAAKSVNGDLIVEITGDCPLIDPNIVDECVNFFLENNYDYISNSLKEKTYPDGLNVQVFPTKILQEVEKATHDPLDREHVSLYIYNNPQKYRLKNYPAEGELNWPELAITLDTMEDLNLIRKIFENLYEGNNLFSAIDIVHFLKSHPELLAMNQDPERTHMYLNNIPRVNKT